MLWDAVGPKDIKVSYPYNLIFDFIPRAVQVMDFTPVIRLSYGTVNLKIERYLNGPNLRSP